MKLGDFGWGNNDENQKNIPFWIAGILFLIWFLAYMVFDVDKEIHFVFLLAVLVLVYRLVSECRNTN
ncbi:DUF5670 family protein [Chryseobacterium sp. A301]